MRKPHEYIFVATPMLGSACGRWVVLKQLKEPAPNRLQRVFVQLAQRLAILEPMGLISKLIHMRLRHHRVQAVLLQHRQAQGQHVAYPLAFDGAL